LTSVHFVLLAARFIYLLILILLLKHAQKNKTFNKHLTSKLQFSPKFTLNSVADSNYRGKCDVGGFLIFEWTLITTTVNLHFKKAKQLTFPAQDFI
jgi:hypothetical protein